MSLPRPRNEVERLVYRRIAEELFAASEAEAPAPAESSWRDDFEHGVSDVVEVSIAARQLRVSVDTVKRWCQADLSLGGKINSRWFASVGRIRRWRVATARRA